MYGLKKYGFVIGLVFMAMLSNAQTISGKLSLLAKQEISPEVFLSPFPLVIPQPKTHSKNNSIFMLLFTTSLVFEKESKKNLIILITKK